MKLSQNPNFTWTIRLRLNPVVIEGSHKTAFPMRAIGGVKGLADLMKERRIKDLLGDRDNYWKPSVTAWEYCL